ncbi:hypothetical protein HMPREF1987_02365 [Peptostreptococcaceae bacterium oral taxon 113 str. W5053]|nr:hypothetical protein HMPREF1987_02365 [Peptostreptococcaceae bacterium oral taxon 113 str. W5053]
MNIKGKENSLMGIMAVLWIVIMVLGWLNQHLIGMILSVCLMFIHMVLGVAKDGKISKKFLIYPILSWVVLWIISFSLSDYYSNVFAGKMPDYAIGGFHPSFAPTFYLYYIGGMLTLTVGYYLLQKEWLSEEDWKSFLKRVKKNGEA